MGDASNIHIGACGWSYEDWRGVFYPEHLPAHDRLAYYARHFSAIEVDSTFYGPPALHTAGNWLDATPEDFRFACRLPREITHERKLRDCEEPLTEFLDAIAPLHRKLACVLVQLPPHFTLRTDEMALRDFILHLPRDFRFAVEFRNDDWRMPRIVHLLEERRVCWVWNDLSNYEDHAAAPFGFLPRTADFLYLRLLGDHESHAAPDGSRLHEYRELQWLRSDSLESWAVKLRQTLPDVRAAYAFAANQFEGFAPATCQRLAGQLGLTIDWTGDADAAGDDAQLRLL